MIDKVLILKGSWEVSFLQVENLCATSTNNTTDSLFKQATGTILTLYLLCFQPFRFTEDMQCAIFNHLDFCNIISWHETVPLCGTESNGVVSRKTCTSGTLSRWILQPQDGPQTSSLNASRTVAEKQPPTNEGSLRAFCGWMCLSLLKWVQVFSLIHYPSLPCVCLDLTSGGARLICWMWNINSRSALPPPGPFWSSHPWPRNTSKYQNDAP